MNAKHLTKKEMMHKIVFIVGAIVIMLSAILYVSVIAQANAEESVENDSSLILSGGKNGFVKGDVLCNEIKVDTWNSKDNNDAWKIMLKYIPSGTINDIVVCVTCTPTPQSSNGDYTSMLVLLANKKQFVFAFSIDGCEQNEFWDCDLISPLPVGGKGDFKTIELGTKYTFYTPGGKYDNFSISGFAANNNTNIPVAGAFVQYCHWNPWFWDYVPVLEMSTFTDWFGNYTIEGVTEDMLPGVIRVYRFGYEVGESAPIWFVPEGLDTIYRFVEMTPTEPPVPPVPPTPPDPPVPPQPDPPQPVPPTPVPPTPVDLGTNVPQTSDSTSYACAIFAMMALLSAGVLAGRKLYVK